MATLVEIFQVVALEAEGAAVLRNKVFGAMLKVADVISKGTDTNAPFSQEAGKHDQRIKWASQAYQGSLSIIDQTFKAVVSANAAATKAQILGAIDADIETAVRGVVDTLADNM
jgi:hypothetical protein